jgi:rod shape determining protein RodA
MSKLGTLEKIKKIDPFLLIFAVALSLMGIVALYSLASASGNFTFFTKQIVFLFIGILLAVLLSLLDFRAVQESSRFVFLLYAGSVLLLAGLFVFGTEIRGIKAWYQFAGLTFEPVEFVKIVFILLFAKYFSARHVEMYHKEHIVLSFVYAFVPAALVFLQPDFGSASILLIIWFSMMLISGIKRKHLFAILAIGIVSALIFWNFILAAEQKERISTFMEPYINPQGTYLDPEGSGYHIYQSIIAVGSGGFFGKGISAPHTQAKLGFLPEARTDFIFAAFCEMFGILGVIIMFLLFALLFWRLLKIARGSKDNFSRLVVSGFMILMGAGAFINIAMNIGLLPITGVPLPFVSYGGSSMIALFIGIGIVESIKVHSD